MTTTLAPTARGTTAQVTMPGSFGVLLLALAAALLANSALGPLGADLVDYPISGTVRNQLIGLEVVTLTLVVPWCAIADGWRAGGRVGALRGVRRGRLPPTAAPVDYRASGAVW